MGKRVNILMLLFSLAGGIIGAAVGEFLLSRFLYSMPESIFMGIYFGETAFFVGLMCLAAEMISPKLNGGVWRRMYAGSSWKILVPATLVLMFLAGTVLQFVYGYSFSGDKKINDVVMIIDTSQSMGSTDPQNKRFDAVKSLMDRMKQNNRVSVFVFNDSTKIVQPMEGITDGLKSQISDKLKEYSTPEGKTNIKKALDSAMEHIKGNAMPGRNAMVILLSDGGDNYTLDKEYSQTVAPFIDGYIPIYTVGMKNSDYDMLRRLSADTGGKYYSTDNVEKLDMTFTRIYQDSNSSLLVGERKGRVSSSLFYGIMRVVFLSVIGIILGFAVGLVFNNRFLAKSFAIGGIFSGLIAGLIIEVGFANDPQLGFIIRLLALSVLSCLFTLFTFFINVGDNSNFYRKISNHAIASSEPPISGRRQGKRSF